MTKPTPMMARCASMGRAVKPDCSLSLVMLVKSLMVAPYLFRNIKSRYLLSISGRPDRFSEDTRVKQEALMKPVRSLPQVIEMLQIKYRVKRGWCKTDRAIPKSNNVEAGRVGNYLAMQNGNHLRSSRPEFQLSCT